MKHLIRIFGIAYLSIFLTSIYDYEIPKIEGGNQQLSGYSGKKIMIIALPITQTAYTDSMLYSLDTLSMAHISDLNVIGVPSFEDGYTSSLKQSLLQWYRSKLGTQVIITDGLYTRKSSGSQQHPLFKWLTTESLNESLDSEVSGPGFMFFVSRTGELNGVLLPHVKIWGNAVQKALGI